MHKSASEKKRVGWRFLGHLPNALTLTNLFCGCLALAALFGGQYTLAFWLVIGAAAADFLDGMAARLLNAYSPLGKDLDSLADMVSFGLVPGVILYLLLVLARSSGELVMGIQVYAAPAFLVTLSACLRLAKFNIDTRQRENFIGLPTPSATLFTLGLLMIYVRNPFGWRSLVLEPVLVYALIAILTYLMVAELPLFSLKFKSLSWKGNEIKIIFAAIAFVSLLVLREAALVFIIPFYVLLSLTQNLKPSP